MVKDLLTVLGFALVVSPALPFGCSAPPPPPPVVEEAPARLSAEVVNTLEIYVDDAKQVMRSIEESVRQDKFSDIAPHAEELVGLAQEIRRGTAPLPRPDSKVIRLLVDRFQHAAHELEGGAKVRDHQGVHHAVEALNAELESLEKEIQSLL